MKYYLSLDCGGTKCETVLFDGEMRIAGYGKTGSANANFLPEHLVKKNVQDCIDAATKGRPVETVYLSFLANSAASVEMVKNWLPGSEIVLIPEGTMHLLAGGIMKSGITALSGTGSGVSCTQADGTVLIIGGYGADFGDQGSGYQMGKETIAAALRAYDHWGEETVLLPLVMEHCGFTTEFISLLDFIVSYYEKPDKREYLASLCLLLEKAAALSDPVALGIVRQAGREMALQVTGLVSKFSLDPGQYTVVASGGAWKVSPLMFQTFSETLHEWCAAVPVRMSSYKTVVGGVVLHALNAGLTEAECVHILRRNFESLQL